MSTYEDEILRALRRITRAIDLHSRQLATNFGMTAPQLVCLRTIRDKGPIKPSVLAREVSLSQATITGIVDRLLARQLVTRERDDKDRRVVTIATTPEGMKLIDKAPSPLQEQFASSLAALSDQERRRILESLQQVVEMMGGTEIPAAPVLSVAASVCSVEEEDPTSSASSDASD